VNFVFRYLILPEVFKGEVCSGFDPQAMAKAFGRPSLAGPQVIECNGDERILTMLQPRRLTKAAQFWEFEPARLNGQAIPSAMTLIFRF